MQLDFLHKLGFVDYTLAIELYSNNVIGFGLSDIALSRFSQDSICPQFVDPSVRTSDLQGVIAMNIVCPRIYEQANNLFVYHSPYFSAGKPNFIDFTDWNKLVMRDLVTSYERKR